MPENDVGTPNHYITCGDVIVYGSLQDGWCMSVKASAMDGRHHENHWDYNNMSRYQAMKRFVLFVNTGARI